MMTPTFPSFTFIGRLHQTQMGSSQFSVSECLSGQFGRFDYAQGDCPGLLDTDVVVGNHPYATATDVLRAVLQANAMQPPGAVMVTWQQGPRFSGRTLNTVISATAVPAAAPAPTMAPAPMMAPTPTMTPAPLRTIAPETLTTCLNNCLASQGIMSNISSSALTGCGFAATLGALPTAALSANPEIGAALGVGLCIAVNTGLPIGLVIGCLLRCSSMPRTGQVAPFPQGQLGRPGIPF